MQRVSYHRTPLPGRGQKKRRPVGGASVGENQYEHLSIVHGLAMEIDVEAFGFDFRRNAQSNDEIDDLENDKGADGAIGEDGRHVVKLDQHLMGVAVDQPAAIRRAGGIDRFARENAREHRTQSPTDTMHAPAIERVVIADPFFHPDRGEITHSAGREADPQSALRVDEARCRGDGDKTRHRAGDHAQHARLLADDPFDEHPRHRRRRGRNLRRRRRHARIIARRIGRAGIEAEPPNPQQGGADNAEHEIMRCHVFGAQTDALAEHETGDKPRGSRIQMHNGAARIIERAQRAEPAAASVTLTAKRPCLRRDAR